MIEHQDWYEFQEAISRHFLSIGADAETNKRVQGIRTSHDIDILVKTRFLGENITWVVEAKHWKSKVSKSHVLALRSILDDIGADRGFIISNLGFQRGAFEATECTNVKLKTFDELKVDTKDFIESEVLKTYYKRLLLLEDRYWSHSKKTRIKYGLRHEVGDFPFHFEGQHLLRTAREAILAAEERDYPILVETFLVEHKGDSTVHNFQQLTMWLNLNLNHLEEKLLAAEWEMYKKGDYHPRTRRTLDGEETTTGMAAKAIRDAGKRS